MTHTPEYQAAHNAYLAGTADLVARMYAKSNAAFLDSQAAFEEYQAAYAASDGQGSDELTRLRAKYSSASDRFKCASKAVRAASEAAVEGAGTGAMAAGRAAEKQQADKDANQ